MVQVMGERKDRNILELLVELDVVIPGEAQHAQRLLLVVVGIVGVDLRKRVGGADRGWWRLVVLPHICHTRGLVTRVHSEGLR